MKMQDFNDINEGELNEYVTVAVKGNGKYELFQGNRLKMIKDMEMDKSFEDIAVYKRIEG